MGDAELPRGYADGYLDAVADGPSPRLAIRMVRNADGRVIRELEALAEVGVGLVAGWPTWQQYAGAAKDALERASRLAPVSSRRRLHELTEIIAATLRGGDP
jgi:hypothetical protein